MTDPSLETCLPADLRAPTTAITRIAAGLSGAGVYRVEAAGQVLVLKIAGAGEPLAGWRRKVEIQRAAAGAGLTPRIVHVDEERRAVLSAFVVDRSLPAYVGDPRTRDEALDKLGRTIRRVHELPLPPEAGEPLGPRAALGGLWAGPLAGFALPGFVGDAVGRALAEEPPEADRPSVLGHNDVNPSNLVYDGERVLLLDWDAAGPNDPFYDLAAIAVFLRLPDDACRRLLAAYDGAPVADLPARFGYDRRMVAALCGALFLLLARQGGHPGAAGDESLEGTLDLAGFYQRLRSGGLSVGSPAGQWGFGLALIKAWHAL